ncbi:patatin-like phospholipase family protein [Aggregicoccus sp. 17bor-14]|uniref:patatin-like phospholipase family protein n=1 Tax=Myxococcaceae TaxID=31 RepID=UPI00129D0405|nr:MULTISPECIES: patatin-like phospholipase family protein [Myxococcaceae]MBF5042243.1 patatin-like phospholipase family protein [Simulacricoccus sp. 17bor-14]MRI88018.1 patatin-like phospholipase family protein [Aggregicoccus sp. 17bor-14]
MTGRHTLLALALALALGGALAAGAQPAPAPAAPAQRTDLPLTLVLSGGVSLGSYEAGLGWTVVEFARRVPELTMDARAGRPRLVAATGASAGSINALLSALLWCAAPQSRADSSVDHNLLRDTWVPVGLDRLLPDQASAYQPGDGLLASRPLVQTLDALGASLLTARGGRTFRPGCQLPVGITVTRSGAEEREVAGISVRTQRFVVPWRLEVTPDGRPRFGGLPLEQAREEEDDVLWLAERPEPGGGSALPWSQVSQGVLASAAFPAAFAPRVLCDCSARCPASQQVTPERCPTPAGGSGALTCPARSVRGEPLTLCRRSYVDGGIFDNAPVGLAIDLTESSLEPAPLQPATYLFVDPELRRLAPGGASAPAPSREGVEGALQLLGELVSTGRSADLARAIRAGGWNRTTRSLLLQASVALVPFIDLSQQLQALSVGKPAPLPMLAVPRGLSGRGLRAAVGRMLLGCQADGAAGAREEQQRLQACAQAVSAIAGGARVAEAAPLTDEEVEQLAQQVAARAERELARLGDGSGDLLADSEAISARLVLAATAFDVLSEEMVRVSRGPFDARRLLRLRDELLRTVRAGRVLGVLSAEAAHTLLDAALADVARSPAHAEAAARVRAAVAAVPLGELFTARDLQPALQALEEVPGAPAEAAERVRALAKLGPPLQRAITRVNALAREAQALGAQRGGERVLVSSSRFAPIAGAQLGYFGAFLDRPLREFDYYAGVYDAAHAIAESVCGAAAWPRLTAPVRRREAPQALDLAEPDTQRCLGEAMQVVARSLGLTASPPASLVLRRLARAELAAALDDRARAAALLAEPAWAWLEQGAPPRPADANVAAVADALLAARTPCHPQSREPLCVRDVSFVALVQALRERGYRPVERNMSELLAQGEGWSRDTVRKVLDRSLDTERRYHGDAPFSGAVLRAHGLGELWMRGPGPGGRYPRLDLDPSTIPGASLAAPDVGRRALAHLLPYRIGLDVSNGGVSLSWLEPALRLSPHVSVLSAVTPLDLEIGRSRYSSTVGLLPTLHLRGTSLSAGPRASVYWRDGRIATGAELRVSVLQDRLGLALGTRDFPLGSSNFFVSVSLADFNGVAYWLLPRLGP